MIVKKLIGSQDPDVSLLDERREYAVYSVLLGEQIKFLVEDDNLFSFPFFVPASELAIVDGAVSKYWKYSGPLMSDQRFSSRMPMLACEEMLDDRLFYQKLVDGDEGAKRGWQLIKEQIDAEIR
jgi:hypothetical protein